MGPARKWAVLLCALPLLLAACGGGGGSGSGSFTTNTGTLSISLTDSPGDYLNVFVTIVGIDVIIDDASPVRLEFADFSSPAIVDQTPDSVTVDLIALAGQQPIEFALGDLPPGKVNQIRLVVSDASLIAYEDVVDIDGPDAGDDITHDPAQFEVKVPSGPQTGIKLNPRDIEIQTGSSTSITLDFDADRSIVELGGAKKANRDYHFILKPVIFILEAVDAIPVDTETLAFGLNFPTGLESAQDVGPGVAIADGEILVANAGTTGTNSNTILSIDVSGGLPVDATGLPAFVSFADAIGGEPVVNSPSGVTQHLDLVWISNAASVLAADSAGTVSEINTSGALSNIFIDNDPPTESADGLVATSGIEFGGFAPNGSLGGDDLVVLQTNGNGSVTGLNLKDSMIVDVLPGGTFVSPSDAAFVPASFTNGDPPGTVIGWLFVTDASTHEMAIVELSTTVDTVGASATRIGASIEGTFVYAFASEPVGIAYSAGSDRLYIANRGNGTITAVQPDGTEIETYDTGLGANALNGIDAVAGLTGDILFLTNTAGNDDPANDAPGVGASTLERVVISVP